MIAHSKPDIVDADVAAVLHQLRSGMLAEGARTRELEAVFRERAGARAAVAVGSGCQALLLALRALGVGAGDEVILPTYVCPEVLGVVEWLGAIPVIVDVAEDYLMSPGAAAEARSARTRALIFPYVMGLYRNPAALVELGVPLIEDCAPLLPAATARYPLHGQLLVYSFEATKWLAGGEGGLVASRDAAFAARLVREKLCRDSDFKLNLFPLSDLQASLVLAQYARLAELAARRASLAARYIAHFSGHPRLSMPEADGGVASSHYRFLLQLRPSAGVDVDALMARCAARGVAVRRPVSTLLHALRPARPCPVAERLFQASCSLPLYPALREDEQDRVIAAVEEALA